MSYDSMAALLAALHYTVLDDGVTPLCLFLYDENLLPLYDVSIMLNEKRLYSDSLFPSFLNSRLAFYGATLQA
jgi:hypothetical protein